MILETQEKTNILVYWKICSDFFFKSKLPEVLQKTEENKLQINAGSTSNFKDRINLTKLLSTSKALYKYYLLLKNGLQKTSELHLDV